MTTETQTPAGEATSATTPAAGESTQVQTPASSSWLDSLPEAYRAEPSISRYDSMESLLAGVKGYANHFGAPADQILRLPKADDQAGWDGVYNRLGRPETPDAYKITGIDLNNSPDKAFVEGFRPVAHQLGVSQKQLDGMMGYLASSIGQVDQQLAAEVTAQREAATAALKQAWGDKYDVYRSEIPTVVETLGVKAGLIQKGDVAGRDNLIKALNVGGEADNPALMQLLAVMADMTAEGGALPGGGRAEVSQAMTVAQANDAKKAFLADPVKQEALHDSQHPQHALVLAERDRLNAIISGSGA